MDEKKSLKLRVIEKTADEIIENVKPKIEYPHQTNPIYKKLAKFTNAKIGDKLSVKDLLR